MTNLFAQNQGQGNHLSRYTSQQPQRGNFGFLTEQSVGNLCGNLAGLSFNDEKSIIQRALMQQPQANQIQNPQMQYFNQVNGGLYDELLARQLQASMSTTSHIQDALQPMSSKILFTTEAEVIFMITYFIQFRNSSKSEDMKNQENNILIAYYP